MAFRAFLAMSAPSSPRTTGLYTPHQSHDEMKKKISFSTGTQGTHVRLTWHGLGDLLAQRLVSSAFIQAAAIPIIESRSVRGFPSLALPCSSDG